MPLLNYTTTVTADKSIAEIQAKLVEIGARRVMVEYTDQQASSLVFEMAGRHYRLPSRVDPVLEALKAQKVRSGLRTKAQAYRVAWRVVKSWVDAQVAIIQTEMVDAPEVFLPYMIMDGGQTVYEAYQETYLLPMEDADG